MRLSLSETLITIFIIAVLMFLLRFLPFLIFKGKTTPKAFSFLEKYIPPISIAVLFIVCLKEKTTDLIFKSTAQPLDYAAIISAGAGVLVTAVLHIWKENAMLSIFSGTIVFMALNYLF